MKSAEETLSRETAVDSSREHRETHQVLPRGAIPQIIGRKHLLLIIVFGVSLATGLLCLAFPARYVLILAVGMVSFALICARPIIGVVVFYALTYIRPQEITYGFERFRLSLLVAVASLVGWILKEVRNPERQFLHAKENYIILGLWLTLVSSTIFSFDAQSSLRQLVEWGKIFLFYFVTVNLVVQEKHYRLLPWLLLILTAVLAFRTDYRYFHLGYINLEGYGKAWDNNYWGLALVMVCPFFYFLLFEQPTVFRKILLAGMLLITALAVVATGSRGAFLGLIAIGLFMLLNGKNKLLMIALAALIGIMITLYAGPIFFEETRSIVNYQEDRSATSRITYWKIGLQMMNDRPLTGVGLGQYIFQRRNYELEYDYHVAHSAYIQLGAEGGVVALALFLLLFLIMIYDLHRLRWQVRRGRAHPWALHHSLMLEAGLWGYMVCAAFLSMERFDVLYLFVALVVVLCHRVGLKPEQGNLSEERLSLG